MDILPAVPQPLNVDGALRFEIAEVDLLRLTVAERRAFEELVFDAARRQARRGVRLTLTSWHDQVQRIYCMMFTPEPGPLRA